MSGGVEQEKCPRCEKVVYDAEGFPAGGKRWHKRCFKCNTCSKKLDAVTARCHGDGLYCKACHLKLGPHESPKIHADPSIIKPADGKGCPRCGGAVYEAEKLTVKEEVYHKQCFTCKRCNRFVDSLLVSVAPDQDIYCGVCLKIVTAPERPSLITDTTIIMGSGDPDLKDSCPRCGGKVFEAEKMTGKWGSYHRKCFKCMKCKRPLDYATLSEGPDNEVYCKNCYSYEHGHKAKPNLHDADVTTLQGDDGGPDVCPRCQGKVFEAEKQIAKPGSYHRKCFTCAECKHQMDPTNFANGPDNDIYCLYCYEKIHGKKAKTKSMPLDTTSIGGDGELGTCPKCSGKVFAAEKMVAASGYYHRHCFRCVICSQPLDSTSVCDGPDNKIYCRVCYKRLRGSSKPKFFDEANVATHTIAGKEGEKNCPRCAGMVFPAEKMVSMNNWYHKRCFSCRDCGRPMDPFLCYDTPDMEIVCKGCYNKSYSVTSEWANMSGGDALKLLNTTTIMADETKKELACPRCNGKVFHNEQILTKGKAYHKKCATCRTCEKNIGTKDIYNGKDDDIYCKSCYARKFGAPGYRGAGTGDWTDEHSAETLRPNTTTDVAKIKGEEKDPATCPRCKGKTFEMERKLSKRSAWHIKCFSCKKCQKPFQNIHYVYEGTDDEIYCKSCFKKTFPENETPLIYTDTTKIRAENEESACPRCNGAVYSAEQMEIKGKFYHKKCMTCKNCSRPISIDIMAIGPDNDLYCNICCHKLNWPGQYVVPWDTSVIPGDAGDRETCARCNGKVFEAEKMTTKRGLYHKKCFACIKCKTQLGYYGAIEGPDDDIYCTVCYKKHWGPGGKNKYGEKTPFPTEETDEDCCVRCKGKVFEAERINAKAGPYHKYCLSCFECNGTLDASTFLNGPDTEIFCKHCYAVNFGHRAKSEYKGWNDPKTIMGEKGDMDTCPRCNGKVFEAEKCVTKVGSFHSNCFSCIECTRKLDSMTCCEGPDGEIYCKACYAAYFGSKSRSRSRAKTLGPRAKDLSKFYNNEDDMLARSTVETWVIKADKDNQDCCPKCFGKVFEAEKMVTANGKWYHKNCFRCVQCLTLLDSLNNNDGPDGALYCKMCYKEKYGPQNRPSDIDLKARNTGSIKSEDPKKNCPRCGGGVFANEEISSKKHSYHKKCATCKLCEAGLTYNTLYDGEDDEIYCKFCYHRKFAPVGYRGAGCADWVDNESTGVLRHSFQAF